MYCFICEKPIPVDDAAVYGGTVWRTTGNFGSRVYDSVNDGTYLEIVICDECLVTRKQHVVEVVTMHQVKEVSRRPAELKSG